jgi:hypothetical protein
MSHRLPAHSESIGSCQYYAYRQILFPEQASVAVLRTFTTPPSSTEVKQRLELPLLPFWEFIVCSRMKFAFVTGMCPVGTTIETPTNIN